MPHCLKSFILFTCRRSNVRQYLHQGVLNATAGRQHFFPSTKSNALFSSVCAPQTACPQAAERPEPVGQYGAVQRQTARASDLAPCVAAGIGTACTASSTGKEVARSVHCRVHLSAACEQRARCPLHAALAAGVPRLALGLVWLRRGSWQPQVPVCAADVARRGERASRYGERHSEAGVVIPAQATSLWSCSVQVDMVRGIIHRIVQADIARGILRLVL